MKRFCYLRGRRYERVGSGEEMKWIRTCDAKIETPAFELSIALVETCFAKGERSIIVSNFVSNIIIWQLQ